MFSSYSAVRIMYDNKLSTVHMQLAIFTLVDLDIHSIVFTITSPEILFSHLEITNFHMGQRLAKPTLQRHQ
jgi:hypothetical protein